MPLIVPVVTRGVGSMRETWRALLMSRSVRRCAKVLSSVELKLTLRLLLRVSKRLSNSGIPSWLAKILSLIPMRIFC